jgi:hypothetical protein
MPKIPHTILDDAEVYISDHEIVITGMPDEDDENHNCDHMGCSSVNHVLFRSPLNNPIRRRDPDAQ